MTKAVAQLVCLTTAMISCGRPDTIVERERTEAAPTPHGCPATEFDRFLSVFAESDSIQREYTADPIVALRLVDGPLEPVTEVREVARSQLTFPVFPDSATQRQERASRVVRDSGSAVRIVKLSIDGTDAMSEFIFVANGCWRLVRINNWSL